MVVFASACGDTSTPDEPVETKITMPPLPSELTPSPKLEALEFNLIYSSLRVAEINSAIDGSGTLSPDDFNRLGELVQRLDTNNDWFANSSGTFYVSSSETANRRITTISDRTWTATIYTVHHGTVDPEQLSDVFLNYTFEKDDTDGYPIKITN